MKLHPLADTSKKYVMVRFIHPQDGKEHQFFSVVNSLTGDRISGFDDSPPSLEDSMSWVKSVVRDLKARAKILETISNL
jgi:hypothetical protein